MKLFRSVLTASILGLALTNAAYADAYDRHASPEQMHERIQARLEKLAGRLEIQPAQQAAWEAYENAVESMAARRVAGPGANADAVAIARFRAERAEAFARKLERIAQATAKLQSVLTEDQRQILNRISRRSLEKAREWRRGEAGHN